jgi:hypothetical protein
VMVCVWLAGGGDGDDVVDDDTAPTGMTMESVSGCVPSFRLGANLHSAE